MFYSAAETQILITLVVFYNSMTILKLASRKNIFKCDFGHENNGNSILSTCVNVARNQMSKVFLSCHIINPSIRLRLSTRNLDIINGVITTVMLASLPKLCVIFCSASQQF